jgi:hypothetical protein
MYIKVLLNSWRMTKFLVSMLSDTAAYMRGAKSGVETLLRKDNPNLLDVDGDVCHHMHNIVKKFCSHFNSIVEQDLVFNLLNPTPKLQRL